MTTHTKNRVTSAPSEAPGSGQAFAGLMADLGRHQMALAVEGTGALCRGNEALRKIQQDAAHDASAFHEETAKRLFMPCQPSELLAIQSELLRFGIQGAGRYWLRIASNALQTQVEMIRSARQVMEREKDTGMKSPLEILQSALPPLAGGFFPLTAHVPDGQKLHS